MMEAAPFFEDIASGPAGGVAHWLTTSDGLRIRVGHWPLANAKGTVLIFPGRTEFVEKYGLTALGLQERGYASLAIDWRGQGIADRMTPNRAIGHVGDFADYQKDVAATLAYAEKVGLPRPYFLMGHSMGGCIGLRSLAEGLDVQAAMFSAPMWGVQMAAPLRPVAWGLSAVSTPLGFDQTLAPGQFEEGYALRATFEENTLTNDPDMWAFFGKQLKEHPDLGLGGPSLRWLNTSLREMHRLSNLPSPRVPCLTYLGTDEAIVDPLRIRARMRDWPDGALRVIDGGKHEMLMDTPELRNMIFDETAAFFDAQLAQAA
ncbi:alpha/beta hydrolase [Roseobacter sp. CCS2]|uniref:alpha/beta hydrolase n=1 Tax=Roseobacter sp. CCS2 TaxID=391593 RepID=UPI0000F40239|nr:alpha/beta hydrolase [Roseobacter sp. CCS2]EBA12902.1 hydrolase, alpha/beta fold family protein [Roseobacter sp. CCS2]